MKAYSNIPFAYFFTFRTYATWLHGDARSSVDPKHNVYDTPRIKPNSSLHRAMADECLEDKFIMDKAYRKTVLKSIVDTCHYYRWHLDAAHIRSNHVHVILRSVAAKEDVRGKLKTYATRYLKKHHPELLVRKKFWSDGGSDRNIWASEFLFATMYYVIEQQGEKMALYYTEDYSANLASARVGDFVL